VLWELELTVYKIIKYFLDTSINPLEVALKNRKINDYSK